MAKKKEENVQAVENEEMKVKFQEKLKDILCRDLGFLKRRQEFK